MMPTKPKKKSKKVKISIPPPPPKRKLPPGLKGARVEEIWGIGKDLWKDDEDLDKFLELIRNMKR
jgi:hypothetical protein